MSYPGTFPCGCAMGEDWLEHNDNPPICKEALRLKARFVAASEADSKYPTRKNHRKFLEALGEWSNHYRKQQHKYPELCKMAEGGHAFFIPDIPRKEDEADDDE